MSKRNKVLLSISVIICIIMTVYFSIITIEAFLAYNVNPLTENQIQKLNINQSDKLMIVAHPDDEVIWGGGHLMEGDYFIVCITNGRNNVRRKEFQKVLKESGNEGIILSYPDKVNGKRDNWDKIDEKIAKDINSFINANDWDLIVTHNENGEYGHAHHKMVNSMVVNAYEKSDCNSRLIFFGQYHKADKINLINYITPLTHNQIEFKTKLSKIYKSQSDVIGKLWHMAEYEFWTDHTGDYK